MLNGTPEAWASASATDDGVLDIVDVGADSVVSDMFL